MKNKKSLLIGLLLFSAVQKVSASNRCSRMCRRAGIAFSYSTGQRYSLEDLKFALTNNLPVAAMVERNIQKNNGIPTATETDLMFLAVARRNFSALQQLIRSNIPLNAVYSDTLGRDAFFTAPEEGETILSYAVKINASEGIIRTLIDENVQVPGTVLFQELNKVNPSEDVLALLTQAENVNSRNCKNQTPLHFAASKGLTTFAGLLLNQGASIDCLDNQKTTPLHNALEHESNEAMIKLLCRSKADVNLAKPNGNPPIHLARTNFALRALLEPFNNLQINAFGAGGDTALVRATKIGNNEFITFLLRAKAHPSIRSSDKDSLTPLQIAIQRELDLSSLLDQYNPKTEGLSQGEVLAMAATLASRGHQDFLAKLLNRHSEGLNIDTDCLANGKTLLTTAVGSHSERNIARGVFATNDCTKVVEFLVGSKASVNSKNRDGSSPLKIAQEQTPQNANMLQLLNRFDLQEKTEKTLAVARGIGIENFENQTENTRNFISAANDAAKKAVQGGGSKED